MVHRTLVPSGLNNESADLESKLAAELGIAVPVHNEEEMVMPFLEWAVPILGEINEAPSVDDLRDELTRTGERGQA